MSIARNLNRRAQVLKAGTARPGCLTSICLLGLATGPFFSISGNKDRETGESGVRFGACVALLRQNSTAVGLQLEGRCLRPKSWLFASDGSCHVWYLLLHLHDEMQFLASDIIEITAYD